MEKGSRKAAKPQSRKGAKKGRKPGVLGDFARENQQNHKEQQNQQNTADIVVVAMTSNLAEAPYSFPITSDDLERGTLNHPGKVRVEKIYTLSQSIIRYYRQ